MKSISVAAAAAVLAGITIAQPHGHHHARYHNHAKRDEVTEWDTVWETVTVLIEDTTTQTFFPSETPSQEPAQFFQPSPSSSTPAPETLPTIAVSSSVVAPSPVVSAEPLTHELPPPPPPETTSSAFTTSSVFTPAPVVVETPTSTPLLIVVTEPSSIQAPPPAPSSTTASPSPRTPDDSTGYVYAGADAFGTSPMDSEIFHGDITYYGVGLGACGYDDTGRDNTANIVAISKVDWMARNPGTSLGLDEPNHPWCDRTITITANGKSTTGIVRDNCPGCGSGSLDVSQAVFMDLFGSLELGRAQMQWDFS